MAASAAAAALPPSPLIEPHFLWSTVFSNVHTNLPFDEPSIKVKGVQYPNSEAYFHSQKFRDQAKHDRFTSPSLTPDAAFKLGRELEMSDEELAEWNEGGQRVQAMREAVNAKFRSNPQLSALLLSTHPHPLVQIKHGDEFWGTGENGDGENMLGVLLMQLRDKLRAEAPPPPSPPPPPPAAAASSSSSSSASGGGGGEKRKGAGDRDDKKKQQKTSEVTVKRESEVSEAGAAAAGASPSASSSSSSSAIPPPLPAAASSASSSLSATPAKSTVFYATCMQVHFDLTAELIPGLEKVARQLETGTAKDAASDQLKAHIQSAIEACNTTAAALVQAVIDHRVSDPSSSSSSSTICISAAPPRTPLAAEEVEVYKLSEGLLVRMKELIKDRKGIINNLEKLIMMHSLKGRSCIERATKLDADRDELRKLMSESIALSVEVEEYRLRSLASPLPQAAAASSSS